MRCTYMMSDGVAGARDKLITGEGCRSGVNVNYCVRTCTVVTAEAAAVQVA